jgi:hypothetical protein
MRSFYQDRLGTNTGKTQKRRPFSQVRRPPTYRRSTRTRWFRSCSGGAIRHERSLQSALSHGWCENCPLVSMSFFMARHELPRQARDNHTYGQHKQRGCSTGDAVRPPESGLHAARYETHHRIAPFPEENERSFAKTGSGQAKAKLRERRHFLSGVIVEETEAQKQSHAAQPVRTVPILRIA